MTYLFFQFLYSSTSEISVIETIWKTEAYILR